MDQVSLVILGALAILAAVIGGGAKAFGVEVPVIASVWRQALLFLVGIALIALGIWIDHDGQNPNAEPSEQPDTADTTDTSEAGENVSTAYAGEAGENVAVAEQGDVENGATKTEPLDGSTPPIPNLEPDSTDLEPPSIPPVCSEPDIGVPANLTRIDPTGFRRAGLKENQPNARLRRRPNSDAEVLCLIEPSLRFEVFNPRGDWIQVRLPNGRIGWVHSDVITTSD